MDKYRCAYNNKHLTFAKFPPSICILRIIIFRKSTTIFTILKTEDCKKLIEITPSMFCSIFKAIFFQRHRWNIFHVQLYLAYNRMHENPEFLFPLKRNGRGRRLCKFHPRNDCPLSRSDMIKHRMALFQPLAERSYLWRHPTRQDP